MRAVATDFLGTLHLEDPQSWPLTLPIEELQKKIRSLRIDSVIRARNRTLLWVLVETGCLVSEVAKVKHPMDAGVRAQQGIEW